MSTPPISASAHSPILPTTTMPNSNFSQSSTTVNSGTATNSLPPHITRTGPSEMYRCDLCDTILQDFKSLERHLTGKKHQSKLNSPLFTSAPIIPKSMSASTSAPISPTITTLNVCVDTDPEQKIQTHANTATTTTSTTNSVASTTDSIQSSLSASTSPHIPSPLTQSMCINMSPQEQMIHALLNQLVIEPAAVALPTPSSVPVAQKKVSGQSQCRRCLSRFPKSDFTSSQLKRKKFACCKTCIARSLVDPKVPTDTQSLILRDQVLIAFGKKHDLMDQEFISSARLQIQKDQEEEAAWQRKQRKLLRGHRAGYFDEMTGDYFEPHSEREIMDWSDED